MNNGVWVKGKKTITGKWQYNWSADSFTIWLDQKDSTTGSPKMIVTCNDTPEFNGWKLRREDHAILNPDNRPIKSSGQR